MLKLKDIHVRVGKFTVSAINLTIEKGDYFVLAGPSGAGKTILLETIAGINKLTSGQIFLAGNEITKLPPGKRSIGLVFQDNTSFPHLSVKNNICYALKLLKLNPSEIDIELQQLANKLAISHLLDRMPSTLSGGELQRVILARTLASKPMVLLLDEPLSSIDTTGKDQLKALLRDLNRQGQTIVHVTHDYEEAISLATKAGVMKSGKIIEQGTVDSVFYSPKNEFTARFCGYRNFFYAVPDVDGFVNVDSKFKVRLENLPIGAKKIALLIPEDGIEISYYAYENLFDNTFQGTICDITRNRSGYSLEVDVGVKLFVHVNSLSFQENPFSIGMKVWIHLKPEGIKIIKIN